MNDNDFISMRDKCTDFYFGKQWVKPSEHTLMIPRPTFNVCELTVNSKAANIVSTPSKLVYKTNNNYQNTTYLTNFSSYLLKEMKYEKHRINFVEQSLMKGTSFCHIFWDEKAIGTYGDFVGGVRMEYIDMKDIAFSNPKNKDIQSQEWIIIRSRASVKSLKKQLKDKSKINLLEPDNDDNISTGTNESSDSKLCTIYLKYFRIKGEVCYSISTKDVDIIKNKPCNPNLYKVEGNVDGEYLNIPDTSLEENNDIDYQEVKFNRYPVADLSLKKSDDSIYGISIIYGMINVQKYINQLYAMQLLNVQSNAWDKYVVRKDALRHQVITDEPGQTLVDYSATGNGIRRLGGMNAMANGTVELANNAFQMLKTINQTNDVFLGQADKELSGVATSLFQSQNEMPIDKMRKELWSFEEDIGKVLELFMKLYYSYQEYYYELDDATIIKNQMFNQMNPTMGEQLPTDKFQVDVFQGDLFKNVKFHVTVEAMQGARDSVIKLNNLMEALFINGAWGNMDVHSKKLFVEMYDMPEKDKFRALIEKEENDYVSQLENTIQNQQMHMQQQNVVLQRSQNTIDYLGRVNSSLQQSYKNEVSSHQKDIHTLSKKLDESDALKEDKKKLT